jgi:hypothetical protein
VTDILMPGVEAGGDAEHTQSAGAATAGGDRGALGPRRIGRSRGVGDTEPFSGGIGVAGLALRLPVVAFVVLTLALPWGFWLLVPDI